MIIRGGLSAMNSYADHLPWWTPAYIVTGALGFNAKGIDRAVEDLHRRPYVWATEFDDAGILGAWDHSARKHIFMHGIILSRTEACSV